MPGPESTVAAPLNAAGAILMSASILGVLSLLVWCYRRILTAPPSSEGRSEETEPASDVAPRRRPTSSS